MTAIPLRYEGEGLFRCTRPEMIDVAPGTIAGWQRAEHRSRATHDHYFACVTAAWANLPEAMSEEFPSVEHLRKYALIKAGFCDQVKIVCASNGEAVRLLNLMHQADTYAIAEIDNKLVTIWRAHSQSMRAMGRAKFQESKEAVLRVLSEMIGTDAAALENAA